ncbi:MAG: hypothetical protein JXB50_15200 [Spirochaetes bacterium]|nr:hypothetical protein [Spirochaetota bacterium]
MNDVTLTFSITPAWEVVKNIEDKIRNLFHPEDSEIFYSTIMTVSELIENAVKYGSASATSKSININFVADTKNIIVIVSNPVDDEGRVKMVKNHIERINASKDPQHLYIERLQELLENPHSKNSQLGLYRIVYEGGFNLSYGYENNILTIKAMRKLK